MLDNMAFQRYNHKKIILSGRCLMEVYEMPITLEEARNYHKVIYQLKMLSPVEWIKTYIYTVIFSLIFSFILFKVFVVKFLVVSSKAFVINTNFSTLLLSSSIV